MHLVFAEVADNFQYWEVLVIAKLEQYLILFNKKPHKWTFYKVRFSHLPFNVSTPVTAVWLEAISFMVFSVCTSNYFFNHSIAERLRGNLSNLALNVHVDFWMKWSGFGGQRGKVTVMSKISFCNNSRIHMLIMTKRRLAQHTKFTFLNRHTYVLGKADPSSACT